MIKRIILCCLIMMSGMTYVHALEHYRQIQIRIPITVNGHTVVEINDVLTGGNDLLFVQGKDDLIFTYDEPGRYEYTVKQVKKEDYYLFDDTEYHLNVEVFCDEENELSGTVSLSSSHSSQKPLAIEFRNMVDIPATGDGHELAGFMGMLVISGLAIMGIWKGVFGNEKDHDHDTGNTDDGSAD